MFKTIVLTLIVLGSLNAQSTKDSKPYLCDSGRPIYRSMDNEPSHSSAEYKLAERDCTALQDKQWAEQRQQQADSIQRDKELRQKAAESNAELQKLHEAECRARDHYEVDGSDNLKCKGIAPDIDNLKLAHRTCSDLPAANKLPWCGRLIPISAGKSYPKQETTPKK